MSSHRQVRRRRAPGIRGLALSRRDTLLLALCLLGLLAAWLFYAASVPGHAQPAYGLEAAPTESVASTAAPRSPSSPSPSAVAVAVPPPAAQGPAASIPQRITYPAAGIDVAVHPLEPSAGDTEGRSIVPPETLDGYWLTPFGTPGAGSTNTTYVIGHSWDGLDAPFNHLSSDAAPGDVFTVATETGVLRYAVDSVTTYTKSTLKDSPVWDIVPNRLVLISCYTEDPWGKNVVVVATPARGP